METFYLDKRAQSWSKLDYYIYNDSCVSNPHGNMRLFTFHNPGPQTNVSWRYQFISLPGLRKSLHSILGDLFIFKCRLEHIQELENPHPGIYQDFLKFIGTFIPLSVVVMGKEQKCGTLWTFSKSMLLKCGLRTAGSESTGDPHRNEVSQPYSLALNYDL